MTNYEIINMPNQQIQWIYLVGTLVSSTKVETIFNYNIKSFNLTYKNPIRSYMYETLGYNVLIIGKLINDAIEVVYMCDSPDVTGKGIVCLNESIQIGGIYEYIPVPFVYLPMNIDKEQISQDLCRMKSPSFELKNNSDMQFYYNGNRKMGEDCKVEIILLDAGGYDIEAPAFYIGVGENPVTARANGSIVTFKGKQICKR